MKQHEDIIKEIREWANANFIYAFKDPRVAILAKLDQLEQEQKDVEVIENTGKEHWNKERGIITKPEGIEIKTKLYEQDIDKIIVVKRSK